MTIKKIVEQGLCVGCGACISESCSDNSHMQWNSDGFLEANLIYRTNSETLGLDRVCPFSLSNDETLNEDHLAKEFLTTSVLSDNEIGLYNNLYAGYSTKYRETSSSGGLATYIFERLLRDKYVDHLFVVSEINGEYGYKLFSGIDDIQQISKTRYFPVTLSSLFDIIDEIDGKIAISGVACFIKSIRLKQHFYPALKEKIPFLVGIICGGLKSKHYTDFLAQSSGCVTEYMAPEYRVKNNSSVALDYQFSCIEAENKRYHSVEMKSLGDMWGTGLFKSNACDFCDDVATELADISLGDAWIKPYKQNGAGTNIIISRSKLADELLQNGIALEELKLDKIDLSQIKLSQNGSFNHRHKGLYYRVNKARAAGIQIPQKRSRFLIKQNITNDLVQLIRSLTRQQSLVLWKKYKCLSFFNKKMKPYLFVLHKITKLNHIITRLYKLVGVK